MTTGLILGGIFLLLLLIAFCPVRFRITFREKLVAVLSLGPIPVHTFPKDRQPNPRDFSARALKKRAKKLQREKERKKREKAAQAARGKTKKKRKKKEAKEPTLSEQLQSLLPVLLRIVRILVRRLGKYLRIRVAVFDVVVATGDAAKTAVLFGAAANAGTALGELLWSLRLANRRSIRSVRVVPDFASEQMKIVIDLSFRLFLWQLAVIAIEAGIAFVRRGKGAKDEKTSKDRSDQNEEDPEKAAKEAAARAAIVRELTGQ